MMVRWMCRVSLKDRKRQCGFVQSFGIESEAEVVRRGRLRWFGHVERNNGDDWVSACRNVMMTIYTYNELCYLSNCGRLNML